MAAEQPEEQAPPPPPSPSDQQQQYRQELLELRARLAARAERRASNQSVARPSDEQLARLDSKLTRNAAFVKRVRTQLCEGTTVTDSLTIPSSLV